jgi:hypothetical protein
MANRREPTEERPEIANHMHGKIKRVSSIKTIYVQDVEKWERARVFAESQGLSMSELLMAGVEKLVEEKCPVCTRISEVLSSGSMVLKAKKSK